MLRDHSPWLACVVMHFLGLLRDSILDRVDVGGCGDSEAKVDEGDEEVEPPEHPADGLFVDLHVGVVADKS